MSAPASAQSEAITFPFPVTTIYNGERMSSDTFAGMGVGTVTAVSATHATVRESGGAEWQVPRARFPATLAVGAAVTMCALIDGGGTRDELARALLNQLLGDARG